MLHTSCIHPLALHAQCCRTLPKCCADQHPYVYAPGLCNAQLQTKHRMCKQSALYLCRLCPWPHVRPAGSILLQNLPHATCHASFVRPQGTLNCPAALHQLLCVAWQIAANVILNSHMIMSIKRFCAPGPAWRPCRAAPSAGSSCPA